MARQKAVDLITGPIHRKAVRQTGRCRAPPLRFDMRSRVHRKFNCRKLGSGCLQFDSRPFSCSRPEQDLLNSVMAAVTVAIEKLLVPARFPAGLPGAKITRGWLKSRKQAGGLPLDQIQTKPRLFILRSRAPKVRIADGIPRPDRFRFIRMGRVKMGAGQRFCRNALQDSRYPPRLSRCVNPHGI